MVFDMAGGANIVEERVHGRRARPAYPSDDQVDSTSALRRRMMEAALAVCGEKGYRNVSVQDVIDRYGGYRSQFYAHFASKARCYAAAYEFEVERLHAELRAAASGADTWKEGLAAVLAGIGRWADRKPMLARGVVVEVHVAGGSALSKRSELMDRLSLVMDGARRATDGSHHPPPVTASFMIGAIESSLARALMRGRPQEFAALVPELVRMVAAAYGFEDSTPDLA